MNIFPGLRYRDAQAGLEFLIKAFGFEEHAVYRDDDGSIRHGVLKYETGMVMLGQYSEEGWMGGHRPDPLASTISIYAVVSDPDSHYAQAKAAGARIVRDLEDTDYGSREYSARDLEGNLWSFGTYAP